MNESEEVVVVSSCYTVKIEKPGIGFLKDKSGVEIYLSQREVQNMVEAFEESAALFNLLCDLKVLLAGMAMEKTSGLDGRA